jgi:hypothetical protein
MRVIMIPAVSLFLTVNLMYTNTYLKPTPTVRLSVKDISTRASFMKKITVQPETSIEIIGNVLMGLVMMDLEPFVDIVIMEHPIL